MSERIQRRRSRTEDAEVEVVDPAPQGQAVDYDALLDEIDGVLESNAEEYVKNFVQKGGQ
ncbi:ubiquitin-like protein Pup [Nigerium sp.]|uniref:ubiquitin-like protein Pup n=1 Tax=Nigerium sp. TaxID=2042655 RepID=UPI003221C1E5